MGDLRRHGPAIAGDLWPALLLAALTVYLSLRDGGFFPGTAALAAVEVALCIAVVVAVARRPWSGVGIPLLVGIAAIAGLAAWTLASSEWSATPARAAIEYTRVLLYALTLVLFGLLPFSPRRVRWMLYAFAAAVVGVCGVALVARTLPEVIFYEGLNTTDRLGYPLNYWNALGFFAGLGIVCCAHLTCSIREPLAVRVLAAAAAPLLAATLYYTLSRGATWAAAGALVVYLLAGRPRALIGGAVATVPPVVVMLLAIDPADALTDAVWLPATVPAGRDAALAVALSVAAAAVLRILALPLDYWVGRVSLPERARRPALAAATVGLVALALGGAAAFDVPEAVSDKYAEFTSRDAGPDSLGTDRLLSARSSGRKEHWDVALAAYRRDAFHGSGAGMYGSDWARDRETGSSVQDAHSFYIELLGELGWPGLAMGALALLVVLGGFAWRARGPDRALFAMLLAGALAWAAQASVDWLWEMPAVTLWLFAFGGAVLAANRRSRARRASPRAGARAAIAGLCLILILLPAHVALSQDRLDSGLQAVHEGDCDRARPELRGALSTAPERPSPYHAIAFCDFYDGRPRQAVRAMGSAVKRDPSNWELHYGLAVARAAAGLDPRRELRLALALNPREKRLREATGLLQADTKAGWRRAGAKLGLPAPGPPIP